MSKNITFPGTEIELELPFEPVSLQFCPAEFRKCDDGKMIVGYIEQDSSPQNPLDDCDGEGRIYSFNTRHCSYKHPDSVLAENHKVKDLIVPLSYFEHGNCIWDVLGALDGTPDFCWDGTRNAGFWVPDQCAVENLECHMWQHLIPGCKVEYKTKRNADGTVDDGNLNIITLTMPDGKTHTGFRSFVGAWKSAAKRLAIKVDAAAKKKAMYLAAIEYARGACKVYTAWCNGSVYGTVLVWYDAEGNEIDHDTCGGYYDEDSAMTEVKSNVEHEFKRMQAEAIETQIASCIP